RPEPFWLVRLRTGSEPEEWVTVTPGTSMTRSSLAPGFCPVLHLNLARRRCAGSRRDSLGSTPTSFRHQLRNIAPPRCVACLQEIKTPSRRAGRAPGRGRVPVAPQRATEAPRPSCQSGRCGPPRGEGFRPTRIAEGVIRPLCLTLVNGLRGGAYGLSGFS